MRSRKTGGRFFGWLNDYKLFYDVATTASERLRNPDFNYKHSLEAYEYCKGELRNSKFAANNDWISSKYMMTTHSILSSKPLQILEEIYKFIGAQLPENVFDEISALSQGKFTEDAEDKALDTNKVSKEITEKWKNMEPLKFNQIREIEENCGELFKKLSISYVLDKSNSQYYLHSAGVITI